MLARQLVVPGWQLSLCRLLHQAFQLNKGQTAPGMILIFCSSPDSSKSISEQKSYPWENPHYYIAILSSVELLWGAIPLPASPLAMNVFAASSMNEPTPGGGLHMAISSVKSLWPSQWSLHASVSSVRSPCTHLLSEVHMRLSPQWGSLKAIFPARPGCPCSIVCHAGRSSALRVEALLRVGQSNHLAKFTARSKSASMHISWTYLKLCLKRHTWNRAELGSSRLCNI